MSIKCFNADVRTARTRLDDPGIPGISGIERGDSDGEVVFTFTHDKLTVPVPIRLLSQNPDLYPDNHSFMLFTDTEDAPPDLTQALANLQDFTFGQNVYSALCSVSSGLARALERVDADGDTDMICADDALDDADDVQDADDDDNNDDCYDDDGMYDCFSDDDDETFGFTAAQLPSSRRRPAAKMAAGVLNKIKWDLRSARHAGLKIGILRGVEISARTHTLSLSVRAGKLGIPAETLEAWDVEPSEYIVLLIRINEPYPAAIDLKTRSATAFDVDFRFGKCAKYKPAQLSASRAFDANLKAGTAAAHDQDLDGREFQKMFISNSLEQFMNQEFLSLFKLRIHGQPSWDDAHAELSMRCQNVDPETTASDSTLIQESKSSKSKGKERAWSSGATSDHQEPKTLPAFLLVDPFGEAVENISTPLVAMQFAMHYFVRCTEYCLRCHRRLDKQFEALKPFVCPDPLCLFQYMTMGLGPSIEHEVLTQPYVVDLLVSLCFSSVQSRGGYYSNAAIGPGPSNSSASVTYAIRDFPTGLRLKVPPMVTHEVTYGKDPSIQPLKVTLDTTTNTILVKDAADLDRLSGDKWVVLQHAMDGPTGPLQRHQAHIKYVDRSRRILDLDQIHLDTMCDPEHGIHKLKAVTDMDLFSYDAEFDDLDSHGKARAMINVLETLPPISHLREYLIQNPHSTLKSCPKVQPAALTLLEWIVASNRSCILQVNAVDDTHAEDPSLLNTIKVRDQEAVPEMSKNHVQFRFAQGTPDKELRFHRALKEREGLGGTQYPTIFAWHGSEVRNWHSILRHGLDFRDTINGRAFGNGVYFSPHYTTSLGYMRSESRYWPNSALKASGAIALCEIINRPNEFVSRSPHYVVQQVDWIQCRYLFVQTADRSVISSDARLDHSLEEVRQDPLLSVAGPDGQRLRIPRKALPSSRAQREEVIVSKASLKRNHDVLSSATDTDEEEVADLDTLFSDDESFPPPHKRTISSVSRRSSVDEATAREVTTRRPLTPPNTDFRPGTLDLSSLPRLALPDWADANSTKRLAIDIKQMQKIQANTPAHELGWYVDFDKIENMFQWIVELHSFDPELPLAKDMKNAGITSIILEVRFGRDYPFSPPFVRVIRPQFLPFMNGGGGHVTIGGAICMELLTSNGWTPVTSLDAVFISVKMAMSSTDPKPARLLYSGAGNTGAGSGRDYSPWEALEAFERAASRHGWTVPRDARETAQQSDR